MKRGFTLIELLVTVIIITILAASGLAALNSARDSAREAKTKTTIAKLHRIVVERLGDYRTRRTPIKTTFPPPPAHWTAAQKQAYNVAEQEKVNRNRLSATRDLMRMELPDRVNDLDGPLFFYPLGTMAADREPSLSKRYRRVRGTSASIDYASAELLYLIVSAIPEAIEQFHANETGDVDGDGHREFIDGWGRPIQFIRWAPGFKSDIQSLDPSTDHDPFDPLNLDMPQSAANPPCRGSRLIPLIYSAGSDGEYGLNIGDSYAVTLDGNGYIDPWRVTASGRLLGEPLDDTHHDNITNHEL
jgi:prepilin-type N-terminal cleavage/methylation domain-containing protein